MKYTTVEVRQAFDSIREEFLSQIKSFWSNGQSYDENDYNKALNMVLPALTQFVNGEVTEDMRIRTIYGYSYCDDLHVGPIRIMLFYVLFRNLNQFTNVKYVSKLYDDLIMRLNSCSANKINFELEVLKCFDFHISHALEKKEVNDNGNTEAEDSSDKYIIDTGTSVYNQINRTKINDLIHTSNMTEEQSSQLSTLLELINSEDESIVYIDWESKTNHFDRNFIRELIIGIDDETMIDCVIELLMAQYDKLLISEHPSTGRYNNWGSGQLEWEPDWLEIKDNLEEFKKQSIAMKQSIAEEKNTKARILEKLKQREGKNYKTSQMENTSKPIESPFEKTKSVDKIVFESRYSDINPYEFWDVFETANMYYDGNYVPVGGDEYANNPTTEGRKQATIIWTNAYNELSKYENEINSDYNAIKDTRYMSFGEEQDIHNAIISMHEICERYHKIVEPYNKYTSTPPKTENKSYDNNPLSNDSVQQNDNSISLTMGKYNIEDVTDIVKIMSVLYEMNKFKKDDGGYASNQNDVVNCMFNKQKNVYNIMSKAYGSDIKTFLKIFDDMREKANEMYKKAQVK